MWSSPCKAIEMASLWYGQGSCSGLYVCVCLCSQKSGHRDVRPSGSVIITEPQSWSVFKCLTKNVSMAKLYSTPSLNWALRIYNVMGTGAGEDTSAFVSDCMSLSGPLAALSPTASDRVAGWSADLRRVALLHQSFLVVCLAQDHVVLQEELVSDAEPAWRRETETWCLRNSRGTQKDSLLAKVAGFPTDSHSAPSNISVHYPADKSAGLERVSPECT